MKTPRLFTYTIPIDDGAAPNPFFGMCSLAICKPGIRRTARVGDWIAGLGSKRAHSGDLSGRLVYTMRVEEVITLEDYDQFSSERWPHRIPDTTSAALQDRLGDCIYDYSGGTPRLRKSVHAPGNRKTDLGGKNVLISRDFYYFGSQAVKLPKHLRPICHQTQGHRSTSNDNYVDQFITWVRSSNWIHGQINGWPDHIIKWDETGSCNGCEVREQENKHDPSS